MLECQKDKMVVVTHLNSERVLLMMCYPAFNLHPWLLSLLHQVDDKIVGYKSFEICECVVDDVLSCLSLPSKVTASIIKLECY